MKLAVLGPLFHTFVLCSKTVSVPTYVHDFMSQYQHRLRFHIRDGRGGLWVTITIVLVTLLEKWCVPMVFFLSNRFFVIYGTGEGVFGLLLVTLLEKWCVTMVFFYQIVFSSEGSMLKTF